MWWRYGAGARFPRGELTRIRPRFLDRQRLGTDGVSDPGERGRDDQKRTAD
jgi:hypothetical protein